MKSLILALATTFAAVGLQAALPPIEVANKVAKAVKIESPSVAPIIDGEMDAVWADAGEWNTIASYIPRGTSFTEPSGPADISGKWRSLWDANNLYIYIEVTDDALVLAPNNDFEIYASTAYTRHFIGWEWASATYDSIDAQQRITLSKATELAQRTNSGYGETDAQLIFDVGTSPVRAVAGLYSIDSQMDPFPSTTKVKASATGYIAEVALTWNSLNKGNYVTWNPDAGLFIGGYSDYEERNFIGFEIQLQDDDDGGDRDTKVAWYGGPEDFHGDYAWAETGIWGTLELGYKTCSCRGSIFGSDCSSQWATYDGGYKWNAGTGFIYDAFFPYVFALDGLNWFYVFSDPSTQESTGYFIYDFGRAQFGWLNCALYAKGYLELPGGYTYTKLRTPVNEVEVRAALPPIEVANKVATAMKIEAPSVAPIIDGEMDAVWADAGEWNTIASYIPNGTSYTEPSGLSDISGKWRALWDANNLYIYIEVTDDALVLAPQNDFEIYTSTTYTRLFGFYGPGYSMTDAQLIFDVGAPTIRAVAGLNSVDSRIDPFPTTTKVKATATGYTAEIALTWNSLNKGNAVTWEPNDGLFIGGPSEYEERNFIGFELQLQDDDGGTRDTKVAWFGGPEGRHGDHAWEDTQVWGTLKLGHKLTAADSIFGTSCRSQWTIKAGSYKWNEGTGNINDALYPYVYSVDADNWFYVFVEPYTNESTGYYIYDFGRAQYGWLNCALYTKGYLVLPGGTSYVKIGARLPSVDPHGVLPPIEVANQVAKAVKVESPSVAPVIDGEMDAVWADAPEYTIASYIPFIPNGTTLTEPNGLADISGKWRALWDANNLYIYIEVTDDALVLAPMNTFEIFTSTAYTRQFGEWGPGYGLADAHLIFDVGAPTIRAVAGLYSVDAMLDPFPTTTKVKATATGYTAEVALTWTSLNKGNYVTWDSAHGLFIGGPSEYEERNFIGFELQLQDDDDGGNRDTKVAWYGGPKDRHGDFAWADTQVWGTLELGYK
ncbi:MAG: sugar-binding protein [Verrucomicrobiota bacterium]|nr:sugar-binding protein [Verrucomicrobiota bacterium]